MGSGGDYGGVDPVDEAADLGGGAGGYFFDFFNGVELVAGVDAFGRVACKEVFVEFQAADFFNNGDAVVFGNAGING